MNAYESSPKGYINLPFPNFQKHIKLKNLSHIDALKKDGINGVLRFSVRTLTPICFTQNELIKSSETGKLYYAFHRENGKLVISGSSLKGSIRSYCEYLSNSCVKMGSASCSAKSKENSLCIVCSTFGTLGILGRIQFNDIFLERETVLEKGPVSWSGKSKDDSKGKIYSHKLKERIISRSVFYETIPKSQEFSLDISIVGLSDKELGLLFLGLGLSKENRFAIKIGRGKNFGFGSVLISPERFLKISKGMSPNKIINGVEFEEFVQSNIKIYLDNCENNSTIRNNLSLIVKDSSEVINCE